MNKIIAHYKNGNMYAHLQYFVCIEMKGIKNKTEIFRRLINSYSFFMNFEKNEINDLRLHFCDKNAIYSLLNKY